MLRTASRAVIRLTLAYVLLGFGVCAHAWAQTGLRALPAVWLTPRLTPERDELRLAASAGYGFTERLVGGVHHRLQGGLALSASSRRGLSAELRVDGRWDIHQVPGRDDSMVGEPRLFVRYAHALTRRVRLGTELNVLVPGRGAPSLAWSATTLEGLAIATWQPSARAALSAGLGGRYDRSAHSVDPALALSRADRLSLGVSSHDALLSRVAFTISGVAGRISLELSSDAWLGAAAPRIRESPLRSAVVLARPLPKQLELVVLASCLLSRRPPLSATLQRAFEPRLWLTGGVTWGRPAVQKSKPAAVPEVAVAVPEPVELPREGTLDVAVLDEGGQPVTDAHVTLRGIADSWTPHDGRASFTGLQPAAYALQIEAAGFEAQAAQAEVRAHESTPLRIVLQRTLERSLLRLQVRDAVSAQPVEAVIEIAPLAKGGARERTQTDVQGTLERGLEPGAYRITLQAPRYRKQSRNIKLARGVSVFLIDLVPRR
jgi:hypothetical protein